MTDVDKEKLRKELADIIPEAKNYDEDLKNIKNTLKEIVGQKGAMTDNQSGGALTVDMHPHEKKHEHRTHCYDKKCPDCGEDNPDYEADQYTCTNCGQPVGTKQEAIKSVACPHCGKNEGAENKAEGWTF